MCVCVCVCVCVRACLLTWERRKEYEVFLRERGENLEIRLKFLRNLLEREEKKKLGILSCF